VPSLAKSRLVGMFGVRSALGVLDLIRTSKPELFLRGYHPKHGYLVFEVKVIKEGFYVQQDVDASLAREASESSGVNFVEGLVYHLEVD
jgi:hypothetical protein